MFEDSIDKHVKYIYKDNGNTCCAFGTVLEYDGEFFKIDNDKFGITWLSRKDLSRMEPSDR